MRRILLAIVMASSLNAVLAQTSDRPKAQLFDEFRITTKVDLIARTSRFRSRLEKKDWKGVYIFLFFDATTKQAYSIRKPVIETLYKDCRDCFGYSPLITFVDIDDSDEESVQFWIIPPGADPPKPKRKSDDSANRYPAVWFAPIDDPNKPDWEILPQEARAGEVILSKRNELGILSNFAATPFELNGKRYASVEGFWQMMLYPEGPEDERAKDNRVVWKYTREQVAQMTAFEAKSAGTLAEENMKKLGIDWCTFEGKSFPYRSAKPGEHYRLIVAAMRAKLEQNPEVKRILLATGDLILKPDHHGEEDPPPEWKYYDIWMQLRSELQKFARQ